VREKRKKEQQPVASYLAPKEVAIELRVARTTVDRLMQLHPEHPDYLEHVAWGQYRSGAKKRRVPRAAWEAWKDRHMVRAKPISERRVESGPKIEGSFIAVLQKTSGNRKTIANEKEFARGTVL
jgi:hypothetical protein